MQFDGVDDKLNLSQDTSIRPIGSITVSAWVKRSASNKHGGVIGRWSCTNANHQSYYMVTFNSGPALFLIDSPSNNDLQVKGIINVSDNQWHYIVGVWNRSLLSIYTDGVLDNSTSGVTENLNNPNWDLEIGKLTEDCGTSEAFNGSIDEVAIWNRSL